MLASQTSPQSSDANTSTGPIQEPGDGAVVPVQQPDGRNTDLLHNEPHALHV
jgi:hypothetical protein